MRRFVVITSAVLLLLFALAANAQVRGTGRLQGNVTDKATAKPIAGATVTISLPRGGTPIVAKTDSRGHWSAIGMTSGQWNIDITAPGYVTSRGTASVSEAGGMTPAINTALEAEVVVQAPPAAVPTTPTLAKDAVDLIKEGEQLLKAKPGDVITTTQTDATGASTSVQHTVTADELKDNAKHAIANFEKALPMIAEDSPELRDVKAQVFNILAQAYYKAGDVKNAIATFEKLNAFDPGPTPADAAHTTRNVLLANLYLEAGELEQGRATLDKLPAAAITDPTAYINIGILFLNKKNPSDAITYFSKAIALDPKRADSYYYRGLGEIQLKRNKDARADLEQVVALSPDSSEAKDAKQLLASLK